MYNLLNWRLCVKNFDMCCNQNNFSLYLCQKSYDSARIEHVSILRLTWDLLCMSSPRCPSWLDLGGWLLPMSTLVLFSQLQSLTLLAGLTKVYSGSSLLCMSTSGCASGFDLGGGFWPRAFTIPALHFQYIPSFKLTLVGKFFSKACSGFTFPASKLDLGGGFDQGLLWFYNLTLVVGCDQGLLRLYILHFTSELDLGGGFDQGLLWFYNLTLVVGCDQGLLRLYILHFTSELDLGGGFDQGLLWFYICPCWTILDSCRCHPLPPKELRPICNSLNP